MSTDPILVPNANEGFFVLAPQTVRWRSRYRGWRESYKINLEMQQFLYDARKLYEAAGQSNLELGDDLYNIEYGLATNFQWSKFVENADTYDEETYDDSDDDYEGDPTPITLLGNDEIIKRLVKLLDRVEALEDASEGLVYDNPLDFDSEPPYNA